MNQLPFLDAKHDYHWNEYELRDIADSEIPVIRVDGDNTVRHVRDVLIAFVQAGYEDGVIPVLKGFEDEEKLVGVIGAGELEHALSIVADDPDGKVHFNLMQKTHVYGEMSVASLDRAADGQVSDPYDFGVYMDQVRLLFLSRYLPTLVCGLTELTLILNL
jgi:chloride channel 3/4/5